VEDLARDKIPQISALQDRSKWEWFAKVFHFLRLL